MRYLTGPPYLGPGGCSAASYKLIPAKQKPILTELPLPVGDQKQPQFHALYGAESWLKLLWFVYQCCFFPKTNFLEAILSEIRKQPSSSALGDSNFASIG